MVKVPEKPFKRYWVVKVYDSEVTGKDLFTVIVPSWCQPDNLKCQFPADLIVSSKVSARVQLLKPPASDWVTFDYAYFSQTGKCKFCILWMLFLLLVMAASKFIYQKLILISKINMCDKRTFVAWFFNTDRLAPYAVLCLDAVPCINSMPTATNMLLNIVSIYCKCKLERILNARIDTLNTDGE